MHIHAHGNGHDTVHVVIRDSLAPFLEWQLHSPPCSETRSLASVAHCQLLWLLCPPLLSPGQRGLTSECNPAHLTFLASSLEFGSSGLPASALTYLLSRLPGPSCMNFVFLLGSCGGDNNCVFRYYGVWGISSHLNVPVSASLSHGRVWSSVNPHPSETYETYFFKMNTSLLLFKLIPRLVSL